MTRRLLIVDDEQSLLDFLEILFREEGYEVVTADSVAEAREVLGRSAPDLVLCDILMPDGNGLDLLEEIKQREDSPPVLMMTAYTSTRSAIEAMKLGAYDYVSKPFDNDELKVLVEKALEKADLEDENLYLKRELQDRYTFANIIGRSSRMQAIFSLIERAGRTSSTVLLQGESGTGKELIARALHYASPRAEHRFLSINCGALPENLLESELFGHVRGAFTGAVKQKRGLFQEAGGGTLLLDEIGEMTPAMQVKLLRVLQERTVRKVGGTDEEAVDVRIVAATNQDLEAKIAGGEFREDLYYRINVIPIRLPPLRERVEDIPLLVGHFVEKYSRLIGVPRKQVTAKAMRALESHDWPGNVRELENLIERCLALSSGDVIDLGDLPETLAGRRRSLAPEVSLPREGLDLEGYLDEVRERLMREALERSDGIQTQAAELLNMSFRSFRYYAKKLGIKEGATPETSEEPAPSES
jgi:two-component system response regulator PilR (NtrC family)